MSGQKERERERTPEAKQLSRGMVNFIETQPARVGAEPTVHTQAGANAGQTAQETAPALSPTRRRLIRKETDPQVVVVRLLEDARRVQRWTRAGLKEVEGATARLNLLKLFWAVRTELVKLFQSLGVLPRELFFEEQESDFDDVPAEVAETISGLLSGRIEPD